MCGIGLAVVAVSCAIIFRSFLLRRQMRQRLERAIAAGVLMPDGQLPPEWGGPRRRVNFGAKPLMWEVSLDAADDAPRLEKWEGLTVRNFSLIASPYVSMITYWPVSAALLAQPMSATVVRDDANVTRARRQKTRQSSSRLSIGRLPFFWRRISQPPGDANANNDASAGLEEGITDDKYVDPPSAPARHDAKPGPPDNLVLSVVIAMPDVRRPRYFPSFLQPEVSDQDYDRPSSSSEKGKARGAPPRSVYQAEEELPDVVLGVVEREWTKEAQQIASAGPSVSEERES